MLPVRSLAALALVALAATVVLTPAPAASRSSGANPGFAGDVTRGDGSPQTCTVCHGSFALGAGPGAVTVEAPATATPGARVPITVALDAAALQAGGRQGFQATVRDPATNERWGTLHLTDAVGTRFSSEAAGYVTHTTSGTAASAWAFEWEPGPDRSGTARVYVAGNAANGDGSVGGDYVYVATADVEVTGTSTGPGPALAFRVAPPRPHPVRAGSAVSLDVTLDQPGAVRVRLLDARGRVVREAAAGDRPAGTAPVGLDTGGLAAGVYAVVVEGPGGTRTRPLVVVR